MATFGNKQGRVRIDENKRRRKADSLLLRHRCLINVQCGFFRRDKKQTSHARLIERHKEVGKTYIKHTRTRTHVRVLADFFISRECFNNIYKYDEMEERRNEKKKEESGELLLNGDLSQGKSYGTTSVRSTIS